MSFLFGGGRPQISSAEKIAMAEAELDLIQDMYNRYAFSLRASCCSQKDAAKRQTPGAPDFRHANMFRLLDSPHHAHVNAYRKSTARTT